MAGKKGKRNVSRIPMESWDDWFENCGEVASQLTEYEDVLWNYYNAMYGESSGWYASYAGKHKTGFYETDNPFPKWRMRYVIVNVVKALILGSAGAFALLMVIRLILSKVQGGAVAPWTTSVIQGILLGIVVALVTGLVCVFLERKKVTDLQNQMADIENSLKVRISYVPPKYRNSIATRYLFDVYRNYPGVLTFQKAIQELDGWLGKLPKNDGNSIGRTIACMFFVNYEHTGLEGDAEDDTNPELYHSTDVNPAMSNPNLPKDIQSKTFKGAENAEEKLDALIGLKEVKRQVRQMKNRMKFYSDAGGRAEKISGNHMCFLGAPGTGKTTVARIITSILYDFGYIKENKCVEVDGGYFKSPYVGQTAMRTQAILDYCTGGVLFIDEAYLMMDASGTTGNAGMESLGVLLKHMEDYQKDFVVIFAGYEDSVNRLLSSNEGFASRIKYKIYFENFTLSELMKIFELDMKQYAKNGKYSMEPEAVELLKKNLDMERQSPTFGNARVVRNALDMILDIHADHFVNGDLPKSKQFVLTTMDVSDYVKLREDQVAEDRRNYIASMNLDSKVITMAELKGRTKEGSSDPDADLKAMTGLSVVKDEIKKMKAQFAFYNGEMGTNEGYHMSFVGAPGTGKSTVAGIMTGYLYQMGIIRRNEYLDINGDFLRGMYLGHTGKRTEAVIQYCQGMVLFVDEAYLLSSDGTGDNFGKEAIGVLLDAMEKHRKDFVVIVAGYDKEMDEFLDANSGFRSRISMTFHFKSYTPHELAQMMNRLARQDGFTVEKPVWVPLQQYLKTKVVEPHFGNARFIRSFWQSVKQQHILNFADGKCGDDKKFVIGLQDVEPVFGQNVQSEEKEQIPVPEDYPDEH